MTETTRQELRVEIEDFLKARGVNFSKPGFYDLPEFRRVEEAEGPWVLEMYGQYLQVRDYAQSELEHARSLVPSLAAFMHERLVRDGRLGACLDMTATMLRILEAEGVWVCGFNGAMTVEFDKRHRLPTQHFQTLLHGDNPARAGHAWLEAPPFKVVDVTLARQPHIDGERVAQRLAELVPPMIVTESVHPTRAATVVDLAEPELREVFRQHVGRPPRLRDLVGTELGTFMEDFPPFKVLSSEAAIHYFPAGVFSS